LLRHVGVRIGAAANLLYGFKPLWDCGDPASTPYYAPLEEPLTTFAGDIGSEPGERASFEAPEITLHDDEESLLSKLFDYSVLPFKGEEAGFEMPSGALMLRHPNRADILNELGRYIGVELRPGRRYMLVQIRRIDARSTHAVIRESGAVTFDKALHLTEEGRQAMIRLRPGERLQDGLRHDARITARQAEGYLDFYYRFGTHFVSAVTWGDCLFQVFAYEEAPFRLVRDAYERDCENGRLTGPVSLSYSYYTRPELASACGPIVIRSGDAQLRASVREGRWRDSIHAGTDSLFAAYTHPVEPPSAWLDRAVCSVPIGLELTPINRFIEIFRAFNWQRVLKGALLYQYGHAVKLKLDGIVPIDRSFAALDGFASVEREAAAPRRQRPPHAVYRDWLKLEEQAESADAPGDWLHTVSRLLDVQGGESTGGRAFSLRHEGGMLVSRCIAGAADSERMPIVRLPDEALDRVAIRCETMTGAFILANDSDSRRYVVADGFCFAEGESDPLTGRSRVALNRRLMEEEPHDWERLLPELRLSLADALLVPADAWHEALSYARWVSRLIPADSTLDGLIRVRAAAAALERHMAECGSGRQAEEARTRPQRSPDLEYGVMSLYSRWNALRLSARREAGTDGARLSAYCMELIQLYDELAQRTGSTDGDEPANPCRQYLRETLSAIAADATYETGAAPLSRIPNGRLEGYCRFINRMIESTITGFLEGEMNSWLACNRLQPWTT